MEQINVGVIGAGWCGGIRANASAASALVQDLHIAEINPERLEEVSSETNAASATTDYHELLAREDVTAIMISATPESTHYPIAKDSLMAGKHVLLEKPISLTLQEADELRAGQVQEREVYHWLLAALQSQVCVHTQSAFGRNDRPARERGY